MAMPDRATGSEVQLPDLPEISALVDARRAGLRASVGDLVEWW
jgi:hypothetical protein